MTLTLRSLLIVLAAPLAAAAEDAIPHPAGWIGTTDQWVRGLGVALVLLNLVVLFLAWRTLGRSGVTQGVTAVLFLGLAILPIVVIFFGYARGLAGMATVRACGECHVMTPYVEDLRDPTSEALSAVHFKNRYIQENQCYACHSDYGMLGTISAKIDGVRHAVNFLAGAYAVPVKMARPYSNHNCLMCHGESQKFVKSQGHPADVRPQFISGKVSCLTCHAPAHAPREAKR